ncbi:MAG TPA: hypothetical protein VK358_10150 [Longimicrobium sp.]|nr:hypothetical protein [Longimicrobium sp.]
MADGVLHQRLKEQGGDQGVVRPGGGAAVVVEVPFRAPAAGSPPAPRPRVLEEVAG